MTLTMTRPWDDWEDYAAGMYQSHLVAGRVQESVRLLSDPDRFEKAAWEMVRAWPHAADHNLYLLETGRRAWIGQATCCHHHGATAEETRAAWGRLSNETQNRANAVATAIVDEYLRGGRWNSAETLFDR